MKIVIESLIQYGLLLQQDKTLPNVINLVTGESLKSSWWSHPRARTIFETLEELSTHPEVIITKLVGGKVTFVHRKLWPSILTVALSLDDWQFEGLSPEALELFRKVGEAGKTNATGRFVKELEQKLLVKSQQEHTASGEHQTVLESWTKWAKRERLKCGASTLQAKQVLEDAVERFGAGKKQLPWHATSKRKK
jgi:hypothetical protein